MNIVLGFYRKLSFRNVWEILSAIVSVAVRCRITPMFTFVSVFNKMHMMSSFETFEFCLCCLKCTWFVIKSIQEYKTHFMVQLHKPYYSVKERMLATAHCKSRLLTLTMCLMYKKTEQKNHTFLGFVFMLVVINT